MAHLLVSREVDQSKGLLIQPYERGDIVIELYAGYLSKPQSLTLEEMERLHTEMAGEIGDDSDGPYFRKRIGDFACYIVFISSIHAR